MIKFEYEYQNHNRTISMYAKDFVKAILIDAMSGDVKLIGQKESFEELNEEIEFSWVYDKEWN